MKETGHTAWDIDIEVRELPQDGNVRIQGLDWEFALHRGGPDILPTLRDNETHFERLDGHLAIGYSFDFRPGPDGQILARGRVHPALVTPGHSEAFTDKTLAEADLSIRARDPGTQSAILASLERRSG